MKKPYHLREKEMKPWYHRGCGGLIKVTQPAATGGPESSPPDPVEYCDECRQKVELEDQVDNYEDAIDDQDDLEHREEIQQKEDSFTAQKGPGPAKLFGIPVKVGMVWTTLQLLEILEDWYKCAHFPPGMRKMPGEITCVDVRCKAALEQIKERIAAAPLLWMHDSEFPSIQITEEDRAQLLEEIADPASQMNCFKKLVKEAIGRKTIVEEALAEPKIKCTDCGKEIPVTEAHPASADPEAPAVCFECGPGKTEKKE